jgi:hypothetical protein
MPSSRIWAANALRSSASAASRSAMSSQPSRLVTSGVPSGAHSVPSRSQIRALTRSAPAACNRSETGASNSDGRWLWMVMVTRSPRFYCT